MEIKGSRVTLRPVTLDDLPYCTKWAGDPEVMEHLTQGPFTPEEEREWLEKMLQSDQDRIFMIIMDNEVPIGTCGIHLVSPMADLQKEEGVNVGIMIGEKSEWGKGYGPEALRLIADFAYKEHGARRVWLTVDHDYPRAIRAYEKAGFTLVREVLVKDHSGKERKQLLMDIRYSN